MNDSKAKTPTLIGNNFHFLYDQCFSGNRFRPSQRTRVSLLENNVLIGIFSSFLSTSADLQGFSHDIL